MNVINRVSALFDASLTGTEQGESGMDEDMWEATSASIARAAAGLISQICISQSLSRRITRRSTCTLYHFNARKSLSSVARSASR